LSFCQVVRCVSSPQSGSEATRQVANWACKKPAIYKGFREICGPRPRPFAHTFGRQSGRPTRFAQLPSNKQRNRGRGSTFSRWPQ
jgi:hypothetical protein